MMMISEAVADDDDLRRRGPKAKRPNFCKDQKHLGKISARFLGGANPLGVRFCRVFDDRQRAGGCAFIGNGRRVSDVLAVLEGGLATVGVSRRSS